MGGFNPIPEPPDPPPKQPPTPKPVQDPNLVTDFTVQTSETGLVLPLLYGTGRVAGNLIERFDYRVANNATPLWAPSHIYFATELGTLVWSNGNTYALITVGTTAGSGGPSGTGSDITDGTAHWAYVQQGYQHVVAIGYCEGPIYGALRAWQDKLVIAVWNDANFGIPHVAFWLDLKLGIPADSRPFWFPQAVTPDLTYANTAVLYVVARNGQDSALPNISLEIQGVFCDATHTDVSPADIAIDLLTHQRRGIGWPSARVDAVSTGAGAASWRTYCTAFGLNLSWLIDKEASAMELVGFLLAATNTEAIWTNRPDGLGSMVKFLPLGDEALTANGVTYTPNTTPLYNLGPDDFIGPLEMDRLRPADVYNSCPVEYVDRASGYKAITVDDKDMADVHARGLKRASTIALPQVLAPASAVMLSRLRAQRSTAVHVTYRFKLGWRYLLLEPGDPVTVSDPKIGLSLAPVRIIAKEEDQSGAGSFTFTAEEWPGSIATAAAYTPQPGDGFQPNISSPLNKIVMAPGQVPMGRYLLDEVHTGVLKAIGRTTTGVADQLQVNRAFYRGSNDIATLGGAPNIARLTINPITWDTTLKACRFQLNLQPSVITDNLDAMRYAKVDLYRQSVAGTTATLTLLTTFYVQLPDRLYQTPGTDSNAGNGYFATEHVVDAGINGGVPAAIVTLYNVNGPSDTHCFYSGAGWTATTALVDNGTSFPAGITGGGSGGAGGGGGGGGGCLDPETPVLVGPGQLVPLRTLRAGDKVWTRHEDGGELGYHQVAAARLTTNLRCRVSLRDGRAFTCSINHLLNVRRVWRRADSLKAGEELQGDPGGHVRSVEYLGQGLVVQLSVPTARTYFAGDGCWHHNILKQ